MAQVRRRRRGAGIASLFVGIVAAILVGGGSIVAATRFGVVPPVALSGIFPSASATQAATIVTPSRDAAVLGASTPNAGAPALSPTVARATPTAAPAPTALPAASPANEVATRFLRAWEAQRFPEMYEMLSRGAKTNISAERFVGRYQAITVGATINAIHPSMAPIVEPAPGVTRVEARFAVEFSTARLGKFSEENRLPLVSEEGQWRVDWSPGLIFRELTPDRAVRFVPSNPVRGAILDRKGNPLAAQGKALTLGLIPGRIKDQNLAVTELAKFLGIEQSAIRQKISAAQPDWWVPLRDFPIERQAELTARFGKIEGVLAEERDLRLYPHGEAGAHVIGFVSPATADDMKEFGPRGYEEGDYIGRSGIELGMEEVLGGVRGGRLSIQTADGETVRVIADRPARNGGNVRLTIDIEVQVQAERILGDRVGSLVLMDPRDNSIVALVSRPAFDPNGFIFGFSEEAWKKLSEDPRRPFQPRATLSTYPTGSVYKVVTMAAALERGGYRPDSMFECNGKWAVLDPRRPMGDWRPEGHGKLDLAEGLVQSCDIVFYDIGYKLNQIDPEILPDFTRRFGLGAPTGIRGLKEAEGIVPSVTWKKNTLRQEWFPGDAVNMSIGQGYLDATPLQVANMYATLANGGILRTPLLIRSIIPGDGGPIQEFQSEQRQRVPVSAQNIAVIRDALRRVADSPTGTALYAFNGYKKVVAAKTGSAENQHPDAHAWFAGYGLLDDPTIVVTVMVEGGRQGGTVAAPLGRQAFEVVLGK